jgi:hypothetical protein
VRTIVGAASTRDGIKVMRTNQWIVDHDFFNVLMCDVGRATWKKATLPVPRS